MSQTLVGTPTTAGLNAPGTSLAPALPAGVQAGDLLLMQICRDGGYSDTLRDQQLDPTKWQYLRHDTALNAQTGQVRYTSWVYFRTASDGETAPVIPLGASANQEAAAGLTAWRGARASFPIGAHAGIATSSTATSPQTAPVVTTNSPNLTVVNLYMAFYNASDHAPPATQLYEAMYGGGTYFDYLAAAYHVQAAAGATPSNRTFVATSSNSAKAVQTVVIAEVDPAGAAESVGVLIG